MARKRTFRGMRKEPFQATYYDATYNTSNSPSPHKGAIQIQNSFLIHSGPSSLQDDKWGSAGCVEIIGNFSDFKEDIKTVSGIGGYLPSDEVIFRLIKAGKLYIEIEAAAKPSFLVPRKVRFLAMTMSERARRCSFGLTKTFHYPNVKPTKIQETKSIKTA
jgi:hypothetical protein